MITAFASGTQTATGASEDFLSSPNVQGKYQLYVDMNAMQANDVLELRVYKMVLTAGTARVVALMTYYGVQPADGKISVSDWIANELTDTNAVRFSLNQTFGTGRAYPWAVLKDDALTPTTTARTLDVTATGAAGIDWSNVENPTTALNLSATNIDTDQVVASVTGAVGSVTGNVGGNVTGSVGSVVAAVTLAAPQGIKKNTAYAGFQFVVYDTSGTPTAGLAITLMRSIDGGAFAAATNAVSGISDGAYTVDLSAADLNGNTILFRATATGAADTFFTIKTVTAS